MWGPCSLLQGSTFLSERAEHDKMHSFTDNTLEGIKLTAILPIRIANIDPL